jgi:hypothetical protein
MLNIATRVLAGSAGSHNGAGPGRSLLVRLSGGVGMGTGHSALALRASGWYSGWHCQSLSGHSDDDLGASRLRMRVGAGRGSGALRRGRKLRCGSSCTQAPGAAGIEL